MPWKPEDAVYHTKRASTPGRAKLWAAVANRALQAHGDDGRAIRMANGVIAKSHRGPKPKVR